MKFRCYFKTNAIVPYNNACVDYLSMLIGQEETRVLVGLAGGDSKVLEGLKNMLQSHYTEVGYAFEYLIQNAGPVGASRSEAIDSKVV